MRLLYPQIIHFNGIFHQKPTILGGTPIYGNSHVSTVKVAYPSCNWRASPCDWKIATWITVLLFSLQNNIYCTHYNSNLQYTYIVYHTYQEFGYILHDNVTLEKHTHFLWVLQHPNSSRHWQIAPLFSLGGLVITKGRRFDMPCSPGQARRTGANWPWWLSL